MWKHIEESNHKHNSIHARIAADRGGTKAYCRHCMGDIEYKSTGYISWADKDEDGQDVINSGVHHLIDTCPHCGQLNNPYDKVYLYAYKKGKALDDYYITADCFFAKCNFDDFRKEYVETGKLIFTDGQEVLV